MEKDRNFKSAKTLLDFLKELDPNIEVVRNSEQFKMSKLILRRCNALGYNAEQIADVLKMDMSRFVDMRYSDLNIPIKEYGDVISKMDEVLEHRNRIFCNQEDINIREMVVEMKQLLKSQRTCKLITNIEDDREFRAQMGAITIIENTYKDLEILSPNIKKAVVLKSLISELHDVLKFVDVPTSQKSYIFDFVEKLTKIEIEKLKTVVHF